jgi:membrane protein
MTFQAESPSHDDRPATRRRWLAGAPALIWEAIANLVRHEGLELSGYMSFMAILGLFPFLIFVVSIAGFIGQAEGASHFIALALDFLPPEVGRVLGPVIANIIETPRGDLLTFGILFAVWSASSGVEAMRLLLNRCYAVRETRSFYILRLQSILFVVLGALMIVVTSLVVVLAPVIRGLLIIVHLPALADPQAWVKMRYGVALPTMVAVLMVLHLYLPNRHPRIGEIWPGALLTAFLWLAGAAGFSIYVANLGTYDITYGSLGGIVLSMLFFYVSAVILGFGAEVNAAIMRRRSPSAMIPVGDLRHALEPGERNQSGRPPVQENGGSSATRITERIDAG